MTTRYLMLAALLAGLCSPALAEDTRGAPAVQPDARVGAAALRGSVVKNAPYSAQAVTEHTQVLADGNQIVNRRTTMTYRDSAGRTRQEFRNARGDLVTVAINDPVAGVNVILNPRDHEAVRTDTTALAARMRAELMRRESSRQADGGDEIIVKRVEGMDDAERQRIRRDVRIQVSKTMAEHGGTPMQVAPLLNGAFADVKWALKATTKDLGSRDVSGIKAEGRLRSYEIPAGEIGNRNPIVVSDETWTAPDLQVAVYTKHSDPRSGDFVFRVENLRREEPPAALFTVPADYTVREAGAHWRDKKDRGDK
jgi:hypothetical protein